MKKQQTNTLISFSKKELEALTVEVKETAAKDYNGENQKLFSAADLWNIQRNKRNVSSRRFLV